MSSATLTPGDWQLESGQIEHLRTVRAAQTKSLQKSLTFASMCCCQRAATVQGS